MVDSLQSVEALETMTIGMRVEYKQIETNLYLGPEELNRLGEENWMLVDKIAQTDRAGDIILPLRYIFARQIQGVIG